MIFTAGGWRSWSRVLGFSLNDTRDLGVMTLPVPR
jgi:hypothetical protein